MMNLNNNNPKTLLCFIYRNSLRILVIGQDRHLSYPSIPGQVWRHQMMLSMAVGTALYMLLVRL